MKWCAVNFSVELSLNSNGLSAMKWLMLFLAKTISTNLLAFKMQLLSNLNNQRWPAKTKATQEPITDTLVEVSGSTSSKSINKPLISFAHSKGNTNNVHFSFEKVISKCKQHSKSFSKIFRKSFLVLWNSLNYYLPLSRIFTYFSPILLILCYCMFSCIWTCSWKGFAIWCFFHFQ